MSVLITNVKDTFTELENVGDTLTGLEVVGMNLPVYILLPLIIAIAIGAVVLIRWLFKKEKK